MGPTSLTVAYVPGGTPAKWAGIWAERHREIPLILCSVAAADAAQKVRDGRVDVALLRLPADTSGLAVIPLYEEVTVAVVAVGHLLTAADEITAADLEGEPVLLPLDDVGLIKGISISYFSGEPVSRAEAREVGEAWAPFRSVATWYIWRSLDPLPVDY